MGYILTADMLPEPMQLQITESIDKVNQKITEDDEEWLVDYEDSTLNAWTHWKLRVDIVSQQSQPNTDAQVEEALFYFNMYNEILLHMRANSPYTSLNRITR